MSVTEIVTMPYVDPEKNAPESNSPENSTLKINVPENSIPENSSPKNEGDALILGQESPVAFGEFPFSAIEQTIHACFESQALLHSDQVAIKTPSTIWTYAELNQAANRIASFILTHLGNSSAQVGLLLSGGPVMISAILGTLKAGKVYVPLDPLFPKKRVAYMIADADVSLIITDQQHFSVAQDLAGSSPLLNLTTEGLLRPLAPTLLPDAASPPSLQRPSNLGEYPNPQVDVSPSSMAYILYTSGSTGQPKGIAFGHRNLLHTTMCLINKLHIGPIDRLTQLHSTSFSASVVDIYCALLSGATLYPWDVKRDGFAGLAEWLMNEEITSLQWIPTPFRHFVGTFNGSESFPHLRQIVMASEPLTIKEVDLVRHYFPRSCRLVNQMGTSESYNYRLYFVDHDTERLGSTVPAGYAVSPDREVLILDDEGQEVLPGSEGEIAIRSAYMSLGYWKNPDLDQQKFLTDSQQTGPQQTAPQQTAPQQIGKRIYLTGDVGYLRPDGCLIHLGRKDFQVKFRGYRIEVGEIEKRLCEFKDITEAIVQAQEMGNGECQLIAYIMTKTREMPSRVTMQKHLSTLMPDYMIPAAFVKLEQLPLTETDKLDRNALPLIDFGLNGYRHKDPTPYKAGSLLSSTEESLSQIWREVLATENIGLYDSFFDLGGHSLKMAQMLQYVHQVFGRKLPYALLMENPTIAALATWLDQNPIQNPTSAPALDRSAYSAAHPAVHPASNLADTDTAIPDGLWNGILSRLLQTVALYAPGRKSLRVWLHRMRGVTIGDNVAIGTAALIETSYPRLIAIGNNSSVGIRTVIIGHFVDGLGATPTRHSKAINASDASHLYQSEPASLPNGNQPKLHRQAVNIDLTHNHGSPVNKSRVNKSWGNKSAANKSVIIEEDVFVGPMVTILPNVTIGRGAVIAAGSVVNQSVPAQTMVQGNPAKAIARCPIPLTENYSYEAFLSALEFLEGVASG